VLYLRRRKRNDFGSPSSDFENQIPNPSRKSSPPVLQKSLAKVEQ
jgi:hypothetical protein